jgi:hypothetical protein
MEEQLLWKLIYNFAAALTIGPNLFMSLMRVHPAIQKCIEFSDVGKINHGYNFLLETLCMMGHYC